jgi:hypothetical protein
VPFDKRGRDYITLRSSIDEDTSSMTVNVAHESQEGSFSLVGSERGDTNSFLTQAAYFALGHDRRRMRIRHGGRDRRRGMKERWDIWGREDSCGGSNRCSGRREG